MRPAQAQGMGAIENKHSTDLEYPPPLLRVCMKYCIHPEGEAFSDLGLSACCQRPCVADGYLLKTCSLASVKLAESPALDELQRFAAGRD